MNIELFEKVRRGARLVASLASHEISENSFAVKILFLRPFWCRKRTELTRDYSIHEWSEEMH